jgi:MFS family permease
MLVGLATLLLILALAALSWSTLRVVRAESLPELQRKSATVAKTLSREIVRAVELGVPLDGLVGVPDFLKDTLEDHVEFRYAAVTDDAGRVRYATAGLTDSILPVALDQPVERGGIIHSSYRLESGGTVLGILDIGVDAEYFTKKLTDIAFDIGVTLMASLLITFEVILILVALSVTIPINNITAVIRRGIQGRFDYLVDGGSSGGEMGRFIRILNSVVLTVNGQARAMAAQAGGAAQQVGEAPRRFWAASTLHIRLPVFVFFFAAELPRSFLPLFAKQVYQPLWGLPEGLVIALPMSGFMLTAVLLTPLSGTLVARLGSRTTFLMGLIPSAIGFVMIASSSTLIELTVWRCVNAAGLAMVSMASLGYIADITTDQTRAQGMASYLGAYVAAGVCGTAIGAIIADRIGFGPVFYISGVAAVISATMVYYFLPGGPQAVRKRASARGHFTEVLTNPSLMALQLLFALPIQVLTFGYMFFVAPFLLREIGLSQSEIGRVIMTYYLAIILVGPLAARMADKLGRFQPFIIFGAVISGASSVILLYHVNMWVTVFSALALGLSSAVGTPAAGGQLLKICAEQFPHVPSGSIIAVYRIIERSGGVAGPLIASALAAHYGYAEASGLIGAVVLVAGLAYAMVTPLLERGAPTKA